MSARGTIRPDLHPLADDLPRQCFNVFNRAWAGAGKPEIK